MVVRFWQNFDTSSTVCVKAPETEMWASRWDTKYLTQRADPRISTCVSCFDFSVFSCIPSPIYKHASPPCMLPGTVANKYNDSSRWIGSPLDRSTFSSFHLQRERLPGIAISFFQTRKWPYNPDALFNIAWLNHFGHPGIHAFFHGHRIKSITTTEGRTAWASLIIFRGHSARSWNMPQEF